MINETVKLDYVVDFLNELLLLDATAVARVFDTRHPCNNPLADHPTVQVAYDKERQTNIVGPLGILNGVFGTIDTGERAGFGAIAIIRDEKTKQIVRFVRSDQLEKELEKNSAPR